MQHADLVAGGPMARQTKGFGDAPLALLIGVVQMPQAKVLAVAQEGQKIPGLAPAGDDHDLLNPGVDQGLDRVVDHRFVKNRQEVLVGDLRQRKEARAKSAGQDDALHGVGGVCGGGWWWERRHRD